VAHFDCHTSSGWRNLVMHFENPAGTASLCGMDVSVAQPTTRPGTDVGSGGSAGTGTRSRWRGVATVLASAASNQVGAGLGAQAVDAIGPAGVVAVRQAVAAAVLLPVARPPLRRMTWSQWWPTLLLWT
jgi:inner membrane transporter RhtA